jgi:hypothetical protein
MSTTPRTDNEEWTNGTRAKVVWASFARQLENQLNAAKAQGDLNRARAEKAEAAIATMTTEFGKMVLSAAARADRNVDLRRRAEKAEAALAKAKATIEDICTGGRLTCDQCLETMPCNCGHSPRRL